MQVKLRLKSIEPIKLDQGLAITYVASTQELGDLELDRHCHTNRSKCRGAGGAEDD